ncbi:hypothetical protein BJY00DRAFT_298952 [Aspergillus carlsbadensis]|nr:hypothetical protein BJY00DRAFT_298952 [Aspergillus carlsbadensis]
MQRQPTGTTDQNFGIDNPFEDILLGEIEADARAFHSAFVELHDVLDVEILVKGAQLGSDPGLSHTMSLSPTELRILAAEANLRGFSGVLDQTEGLRTTILATACAAVALGTWISDPLQGFSFQKPAFGTKASVAPIFAAEAAMEKSRGRILMLWQLFDALGIMLGFVVALIAPDSWEVQLGAALIPSLVLMIVVMLCPESPRLLMRKKRYAEAFRSLRRLRKLEIQAARDFYCIHLQLQREFDAWRPDDVSDAITSSRTPCQDFIEQQNVFQRMFHLITLERNSRACVVAFFVMASQQLCGINVLAYYSSTVFRNTTDLNAVNLMSFAFGAANFLFTMPAFFLIDAKGRRFILLISFVGMTISLLMASFSFQIISEGGRIAAVSILVIVLFTSFYSIGAGPVPFTLSAEIFPLAFREVGMSFSVMVNFVGLGLLVLFVPRITRRIGQRNVLFILAYVDCYTIHLQRVKAKHIP